MKLPDLQMLAHWLDPALVATLETRRRKKKEWHRRRKLATLQTLWLMLAVSLDTQDPACMRSCAWLLDSLASNSLFP